LTLSSSLFSERATVARSISQLLSSFFELSRLSSYSETSELTSESEKSEKKSTCSKFMLLSSSSKSSMSLKLRYFWSYSAYFRVSCSLIYFLAWSSIIFMFISGTLYFETSSLFVNHFYLLTSWQQWHSQSTRNRLFSDELLLLFTMSSI